MGKPYFEDILALELAFALNHSDPRPDMRDINVCAESFSGRAIFFPGPL
jgi:hypothetical protein